jgi:hypothetical protein
LAIAIHATAAAGNGREIVFPLTKAAPAVFTWLPLLFLLLQEFVDVETENFAGYGFELVNNLGFVLHFLGILFGQAGG